MGRCNCCLSEKTRKHVSIILWRFKLQLSRHPTRAITPYYITFMGLLFLLILHEPPVSNPGGDGFDRMRTIKSTNWPVAQETGHANSSVIDFEAENESLYGKFASACVDQRQSVIGLVGDTQKARMIYRNKIQNFMLPEQLDYFQEVEWSSEEEMQEYHLHPERPFEEGQICFALVVNQWGQQDARSPQRSFTVKIRYARPAWAPLMARNLTHSESTTTYDFESGFYNYLNGSLIEIMSAVTEQVIEDVNADNADSFNGAYQLKLTPTYQEESQSLGFIAYIIMVGFISFSLNLLPLSGFFFIRSNLEPHEAQLWKLSYSMGMKHISWVIALFVVTTVGLLVYGTVVSLIIGFIHLSQSSFWILVVTILVFVYCSFFQAIFLIVGLGKVGTILFIAGSIGQFVYNILFADRLLLQSRIAIALGVLGPQIPFQNLIRTMALFQVRGGLHWSNLNENIQNNNGQELLLGLIGLFVLYFLLTLWVWPLQFSRDGRKRTVCYCLNPYNWCRAKSHDRGSLINEHRALLKQDHEDLLMDSKILLKEEKALIDRGDLEVPELTNQIMADEQYLQDTLRVNKLVREFKNHNPDTKQQQKKVRAVNELSVSMFKNQIFVLLGHNGAGKTTTMSILSGQLDKSDGKAYAFGHDVFVNEDQMHEITGICPQKDVLLESLTVWENLYYFCSIRMMSPEQIDKYATRGLEKLAMSQKRDSIVRTLSGGQKRKLQLLIALSGKVKFILLDEPSSGMDPTARKDTWDMIKSSSKGKIMILTTHYMDEAEALGDRIGIMSKGQLKVCGSSLFLKNRYGLGALLEVSMRDKTQTEMLKLEEFLETYRKSALKQRTRSQLTESEIEDHRIKSNLGLDLESEIKGQVDESNLYVIKLPNELKPYFTEIFEHLDQSEVQKQMNIETYNVRVTSLEEVFNALGNEEMAKQSQQNLAANKLDEEDLKLDGQPMEVKNLTFFQHSKIILANRIRIIRMKRTLCWQLLLPVLILVFGFWFMIQNARFREYEPLQLSRPEQWFNSSFICYNLGFQSTNFSDNAVFTAQDFSNSVCSTTGINCLEVNNIRNEDEATMASQFSMQSLQQSMDDGTPFHGLFFVGNQEGSTGANEDFMMSLYIMSNLTTVISMPIISAQGLNAIARLYTNQDDLQINYDFALLPDNPVVAMSGIPLPPFATISVGTFLLLAYLNFTFFDIDRSARLRDQGILRQYILIGVPEGSFLLVSALLISLSIFLTGVIFIPMLEFLTKLYFRTGPLIIMAISMVSVPLYATLLYLISSKIKGAKIDYQNRKIVRFVFYILGAVVCFLVFFGFWLPGVVLEIIISINPIVSATFIWMKYIFAYIFWVADDPMNPTPGLEWWSFNRSLPGLIGQGISIIVSSILILILVKRGAKKHVNDGNMKRIQARQKEFGNVAEGDLNPQFLDFFTDSLVRQEQERVMKIMSGQLPPETVAVSNLKKFFITKKLKSVKQDDKASEMLSDVPSKSNLVKAIQGISFALNKGECFILLGVNGAGKSTTFKCLATDEVISSGDIKIGGRSIAEYHGNQQLMANIIGYCPQISPIDDEMTICQKLTLLGQMKGLDADLAQRYAKLIAKKFEIYQFFHTYADKLSGGNQRKLMTAIAMFSNPELIMLDEASAGVDPFSRRRLWRTIRDFGEKSALVVTTHSMEEAEALGTKMAIQVDGRFKCFGTAQQIKQRFGQGFTAIFKLDLKKLDQRINQFTNSNGNQNSNITRVESSDLTRSEIRSQSFKKSNWSLSQSQNDPIADNTYMSLDKVRERIVQWFQSENADADDYDETDLFVAEQFKNELKPNGLLAAQYNLIVDNKPIDLQQLFKQILLLSQISYIVSAFGSEFGDARLVDFTGNQLTVKISNDFNKSIGFLFGFIEKMREDRQKFAINEYQAEQTTLEQIFNQFAKEKNFAKLNQSIKSVHSLRQSRIKV